MAKGIDALKSELTGLSKWKKLAHPKVKKSLVGAGIGWCVAVSGAAIALNGHAVIGHNASIWTYAAWDAFGYTIHAVGTVPLLWYAEKVWTIFKD